jgi:hypothetical protein
MKPSSANRQLLGLVRNTRRAHSLSGTEIGLDASNNNIRLLSERREKNFFLTFPSYRAEIWALSVFWAVCRQPFRYARTANGGVRCGKLVTQELRSQNQLGCHRTREVMASGESLCEAFLPSIPNQVDRRKRGLSAPSRCCTRPSGSWGYSLRESDRTHGDHRRREDQRFRC